MAVPLAHDGLVLLISDGQKQLIFHKVSGEVVQLPQGPSWKLSFAQGWGFVQAAGHQSRWLKDLLQQGVYAAASGQVYIQSAGALQKLQLDSCQATFCGLKLHAPLELNTPPVEHILELFRFQRPMKDGIDTFVSLRSVGAWLHHGEERWLAWKWVQGNWPKIQAFIQEKHTAEHCRCSSRSASAASSSSSSSGTLPEFSVSLLALLTLLCSWSVGWLRQPQARAKLLLTALLCTGLQGSCSGLAGTCMVACENGQVAWENLAVAGASSTRPVPQKVGL
eukprot:2347214-Lingulodinium_polyedra.AAC.1